MRIRNHFQALRVSAEVESVLAKFQALGLSDDEIKAALDLAVKHAQVGALSVVKSSVCDLREGDRVRYMRGGEVVGYGTVGRAEPVENPHALKVDISNLNPSPWSCAPPIPEDQP